MQKPELFEKESINETLVRKYFNQETEGLSLQVFPVVDSTNVRLREQAKEGAPDGTVIIAGEQTAGKGRLGRSFYSPSGTGVYLSLLLRQEEPDADLTGRITTMAAVAASEAIEKVSGKKAGIKWVNDIYMEGKKVCGILAEGSFSQARGILDSVILGIGFNVFLPGKGFPEELSEKAGAILDSYRDQAREQLAAEFLNRFFYYYHLPDHKSYVEKYRERCFVTGQKIDVVTPAGKRRALALSLDENCRLKVRYEDGKEEDLSSGEISIRPVGNWGK